jgi:hypothetical protein
MVGIIEKFDYVKKWKTMCVEKQCLGEKSQYSK